MPATPIERAAEVLVTSRPGRKLGLAGRPGVAREVFESIDTDELAEVLIEAYTDWMGAGCPGSSTSFQAEAVKAHLLKEDA